MSNTANGADQVLGNGQGDRMKEIFTRNDDDIAGVQPLFVPVTPADGRGWYNAAPLAL